MDIVVTLSKSFGLQRWIEEGDPAGTEWGGQKWGWHIGKKAPTKINPGERVYVVYDKHLIGYSPLLYIEKSSGMMPGYVMVRGGNAVAVTIDAQIKSFRGFRYRWWQREIERPFPEWRKLTEPIKYGQEYRCPNCSALFASDARLKVQVCPTCNARYPGG